MTLVGLAAQACVRGLGSVVKPGCVCSEVHLADVGTIPKCRQGFQNLMTYYRAVVCFYTCEPQI